MGKCLHRSARRLGSGGDGADASLGGVQGTPLIPSPSRLSEKLPDFDDVEAEDRAMAHALGFRIFEVALAFFKDWPDHNRAAQAALARASEINGNTYYLLDPAARLIEGKHPLAATLLRRAMIEDTLNGAKSTRYKHAARHLLECSRLAPIIQDFGTFETRDSFVTRLRARHGRKTGFWAQLAGSSEGRP